VNARVLLPWLAVACAPAVPLGLSQPPDGMHTLILALDPPGCESGFCDFAYVYRDGIIDEPLTLPAGEHRIYALYYPSKLEELMIEPGPLETCRQSCASRRLPQPAMLKSAGIRGLTLDAFVDQTELPSSIAELELPAIDPFRCAAFAPPRCFQ
jgi:hypothetical protein